MNPQQCAERSAAAMMSRDPASLRLGIELQEIRPGFARMSMVVTENMLNGHSTCHGGYVFTLADSSFAFACNSYNRVTVASNASIDFLAPAHLGDRLIAVAEERSQAGRTGVYDVVVKNQDGTRIALFRGRSHRIKGTLFDEADASPSRRSV